MTPPHPDILTVRDAEILRLLNRVVSIGEYRRQFTAQDVHRVASKRLPAPEPCTVVKLRAVPAPEPVANPDAITIELSPHQAAVVRELCKEGASNAEIAETLGSTEETVKSHLRRAYAAVGVRDRGALIAVVSGGQVVITMKTNGNRKKAK